MADRGRGVRGRSAYALAVASDVTGRASKKLVTEGGPTLQGDRWVEWSFVFARMADGDGRTMDFGADIGFLSLAAAQRGHDVIALDREPSSLDYEHPKVTHVQADVLEWEPDEPFDQILNCSSVEHVGLAGRYHSFDSPDGDIDAMNRMATMLTPGGRMLLTIPVGRDMVCGSQHRIYGEERLPRLTGAFAIAEEQFWHKTDRLWEQTSRETALQTQGGEAFYSLGLFVLQRA